MFINNHSILTQTNGFIVSLKADLDQVAAKHHKTVAIFVEYAIVKAIHRIHC